MKLLFLSALLLSPALSARIMTFANRGCMIWISQIEVGREIGCSNIPGGDQVWGLGYLDAAIPAGCKVGFFSDESCNTNVLYLDDTAQPDTCWEANSQGVRTYRVDC